MRLKSYPPDAITELISRMVNVFADEFRDFLNTTRSHRLICAQRLRIIIIIIIYVITMCTLCRPRAQWNPLWCTTLCQRVLRKMYKTSNVYAAAYLQIQCNSFGSETKTVYPTPPPYPTPTRGTNLKLIASFSMSASTLRVQ